jgi:murein DD-endopeptidase / murein LD-carboxypeptidase
MTGAEIVEGARSLVGAPFRPQGRAGDPGLDCIGLAAAALGVPNVPRDYALRDVDLGRLEEGLRKAGLQPAKVSAPGAVLVMNAGSDQLHLGIWTGSGLVHADAGLRRVVERPGPPPWPVLGIWIKEE